MTETETETEIEIAIDTTIQREKKAGMSVTDTGPIVDTIEVVPSQTRAGPEDIDIIETIDPRNETDGKTETTGAGLLESVRGVLTDDHDQDQDHDHGLQSLDDTNETRPLHPNHQATTQTPWKT